MENKIGITTEEDDEVRKGANYLLLQILKVLRAIEENTRIKGV